MAVLHHSVLSPPDDLLDRVDTFRREVAAYIPVDDMALWHIRTWSEGNVIVRHHLEVVCPYRGVVQSNVGPAQYRGILWKLAAGERISAAILDAADVFWGNYDCTPDAVWMDHFPVESPTVMRLKGACDDVEVDLIDMPGMPKGCILLIQWVSRKGESTDMDGKQP